MGTTFNFELGEGVVIVISGERGNVVGRSEHLDCVPQYLVRYKAGDGRGIESWWSQDALNVDPTNAD